MKLKEQQFSNRRKSLCLDLYTLTKDMYKEKNITQQWKKNRWKKTVIVIIPYILFHCPHPRASHTQVFFLAHTIGHISFDTAVVGNSLDIKWVFFFLIKGQVLKYLDTTKVIQAESPTIGLMAVVIRALHQFFWAILLLSFFTLHWINVLQFFIDLRRQEERISPNFFTLCQELHAVLIPHHRIFAVLDFSNYSMGFSLAS